MSGRSGWRALAHRRRTLPGVSSPLSVVRSMSVTALSSHAACHSFLTVRRVGMVAARRSAALRFTRTASTRSRSSGSPAFRGTPFDDESWARIRPLIYCPSGLWPSGSESGSETHWPRGWVSATFRFAAPGLAGSGARLFPLAVMIEELKQKLGDEVERLTHELNVVLPNEIRKAVELCDLRETTQYKAALERQQFVQARLSQLRQRLSKLSQIDMAQIPLDKVGLGSRVVVLCEDSSAKETYYLVFADAENFDEGHVTMASPIGRALIGKAVGDNVQI